MEITTPELDASNTTTEEPGPVQVGVYLATEPNGWKTRQRFYDVTPSSLEAIFSVDPPDVQLFVTIIGRGNISTVRFEGPGPHSLKDIWEKTQNGNSYEFAVFCHTGSSKTSGLATASDLPLFIVKK